MSPREIERKWWNTSVELELAEPVSFMEYSEWLETLREIKWGFFLMLYPEYESSKHRRDYYISQANSLYDKYKDVIENY